MNVVVWILVAVATLLVVARLGMFSGRPPDNLGVREGKLKPPSKTANSVSSQAGLWPGHPQREAASIAPLTLVGDGPATIARLATLIESMPGAHIVERRPDYLYAQFTTRLMHFVDDAEFWFDPRPAWCKCAQLRASGAGTWASTAPASRRSGPSSARRNSALAAKRARRRARPQQLRSDKMALHRLTRRGFLVVQHCARARGWCSA